MCSHYQAERNRRKLERMGARVPDDWQTAAGPWDIYPTLVAPIIRRPPELESGDDAVPPMEVVPAHFGLLPSFAKDIGFGKHTYNARTETVAEKPSFKHAWANDRHCIVPCEAIFEPDWRSGRSVPTRITRADGEPLGVAGIWQPWRAPNGEWVLSFAMLTINADTHPIFRELHKPDPKLPPDRQDKRMVVILGEDSYDAWLDAPESESMEFMRQYPAELLSAEAPSVQSPMSTLW
ncbi:MAG: SOS response-associated peptidase [bacterium]